MVRPPPTRMHERPSRVRKNESLEIPMLVCALAPSSHTACTCVCVSLSLSLCVWCLCNRVRAAVGLCVLCAPACYLIMAIVSRVRNRMIMLSVSRSIMSSRIGIGSVVMC